MWLTSLFYEYVHSINEMIALDNGGPNRWLPSAIEGPLTQQCNALIVKTFSLLPQPVPDSRIFRQIDCTLPREMCIRSSNGDSGKEPSDSLILVVPCLGLKRLRGEIRGGGNEIEDCC